MHSRSRRTLQRRVSTHKVILREAWRGPEDVLSEGSTLFYLKLYPLIIQVQWFPVVTSYICVQSALQCQYFNAVAVFPTFTLIDFPLRHLVAFPIQRRLQQTGCRSPPFFFLNQYGLCIIITPLPQLTLLCFRWTARSHWVMILW